MIIGILSDTHGRADMAAAAVTLLRAAGAEYLFHCGDIGEETVLDALAGTPASFVFGNNDDDRRALTARATALGIDCLDDSGGIELAGKWIAVTHGDDAREVGRLCAPGSFCDYLLTGHSHVPHDRRVARIRWINPGALYRAATKTVATLDLATDVLTFIDVPDRTGR